MPPPPPASELVARFRRDFTALVGCSPGRIGIALSGGPDSIALLLLAAAAFPGGVAAATVDHGLRPEGADEAAFAASVSATLGVPHTTLRVSVPSGASVQAKAREARYAVLRRWASEEEIAVLATGHHADDQAETLIMRLLRGAGVAGLAGVRARAAFGATNILCRPLLAWRREELAAIVEAAGIKAVADPSNSDERYDRARIRRQLAETPWLDPLAIARSAAALAEADAALDELARDLAAERLSHGDGWASLRPDGVPSALLRRLVERALRHVVPQATPRGEQVGALIAQLEIGGTVTLAGVICSGGPSWRFAPEPRRRSVSLKADQ